VVAEHATGNLVVFDVATGFLVQTYAASTPGLMGLQLSRDGNRLFGVNAATEELLEFRAQQPCTGEAALYAEPSYQRPASLVQEDNRTCSPNSSIPDARLFVQVHTTSGYASNDTSVQNDSMMDSNAALLINRTDCEANSSLNFDALLLGGWHCHPCLPDNCADLDGGHCVPIQWTGYTCDNELHLDLLSGRDGSDSSDFSLDCDALMLESNRPIAWWSTQRVHLSTLQAGTSQSLLQ